MPKLERGVDAANPPLPMLAELTPSAEEVDHFSIYEVEDEEKAAVVAAALAMVSGMGPTRTVFATAQIELLAAGGLKIQKTAGETHVPPVDALHRNLGVPNQGALALVASHFINSEPIIVELDQVRRAVQTLALAGHYDFAAIAYARRKSGNPRAICESALSLVATKHLIVQPPEAAAA